MNLGNVSNVASKAASSAGTNAVGNVSNAAASATNATSALNAAPASSPVPKSGSNVVSSPNTLKPSSEVVDTPSLKQDIPSKTADDVKDFIADATGDDNPPPPSEPASNQPEVGEKVDHGKEIGTDGNVQDSSTKKLLKGVGRGAAAYATGGESLKYDQAITNNGAADKLIGVVSDGVEKVPGVEAVASELDEMGITDTANDAMDLAGNALNGDIEGTVEKAKDTLEGAKKVNKNLIKKMIVPLITGLLFTVIIFVVIFGPIIGGTMELTDGVRGLWNDVVDFFTFTDQDIIDDIPDYDTLSSDRKAIIDAAISALGRNYKLGGHASSPGLAGIPTSGLDCSGYVEWVLWTGLGEYPGRLTTQSISDTIGSKFIEISEDELQPGDIGLKRTGGSSDGNYNHTGIYAGNGYWFHAASSKKGIIRSKYKSFKIYLRYVGVE